METTTTECLDPMTTPNKPRGRPKVSPENKRVSYSLSLKRPTADIYAGFIDQLAALPKHKRKGHLFEMIAKWLVASHFNPNN